MATYLLLRNNKESGPLSFDELIKIGLKPYDLVWVNGRSAAWRYPSEIKELVPYAPVVEEQPYDRFYQKSTEQNPEITKDQPAANNPLKLPNTEHSYPVERDSPAYHQPLQKEERPAPTNKNVFVSFPDRKTVDKPKSPVENKRTIEPEYANVQKTEFQPAPLNAIPENKQSIPMERNEPIELEEKYSQPLDEIKQMYVQTLNQRKKRNARRQALLNGMKIAAAVLVILSVGMFIGMYFDKDTQPAELVNQPAKKDIHPTELSSTSFVSNANTEEMPSVNNDKPVNAPYNDYQLPTTEKKTGNLASNKTRSQQNNKQVPYSGTVTDSQTNERKRVIREDDSALADGNEKINKKGSIENIWDDVTIKANDFKTGPFGGIKDLTITLANKSTYPLDKVEIEVKYIGLEKQVVKIQKMVFNDVVPGGQVHADVPRTGRGMDVDVTIKKINVRDFSFARSEK